jgi:hypothetical protein
MDNNGNPTFYFHINMNRRRQHCQEAQEDEVGFIRRPFLGAAPAAPEDVLHDQQRQQHAVDRQRQRAHFDFEEWIAEADPGH